MCGRGSRPRRGGAEGRSGKAGLEGEKGGVRTAVWEFEAGCDLTFSRRGNLMWYPSRGTVHVDGSVVGALHSAACIVSRARQDRCRCQRIKRLRQGTNLNMWECWEAHVDTTSILFGAGSHLAPIGTSERCKASSS